MIENPPRHHDIADNESAKKPESTELGEFTVPNFEKETQEAKNLEFISYNKDCNDFMELVEEFSNDTKKNKNKIKKNIEDKEKDLELIIKKIELNIKNILTNNNYIENISKDKLLQKFWLNNFDSVFEKKIDTWDYQWYFTTWINGGISIIPTVNMISNIGFGAGATHTSDSDSKLSAMQKSEIDLNLVHPRIMMPNIIYDKYNAKYLFGLNYFNFYKNQIKRIIKKIIRKVQ